MKPKEEIMFPPGAGYDPQLMADLKASFLAKNQTEEAWEALMNKLWRHWLTKQAQIQEAQNASDLALANWKAAEAAVNAMRASLFSGSWVDCL
jgi:hypothetical protein